MFTGILAFLAGLITLAMGGLMLVLPLFGDASSIITVFLSCMGTPLTIVGFGMIVRGFTLRKDNEDAYKVGESMRDYLGSDNRYTFIRNVSQRRLGYIDAVLVGPPGALVIRIVNHEGEWINERAEWRIRKPNKKLATAPQNPTRECAKDVYALRKLLAKKGANKVPVYGVVVFVGEKVSLKANGPIIPVAEPHTLYRILNRSYMKDERINSSQIRKTVDIIVG